MEKSDTVDVIDAATPPAAGWTPRRTPSAPDGATHIVWTATSGHELKPDAHRYFDVRVGPLPKEAILTFDVAQTYSDGSVVNWNESGKGGEEPDFPAPVLVLDAAAAKARQARQAASAQPAQPAPTVAADSPAKATTDTDDRVRARQRGFHGLRHGFHGPWPAWPCWGPSPWRPSAADRTLPRRSRTSERAGAARHPGVRADPGRQRPPVVRVVL
ncbi:DUF1775 domain-containing protein [Streptomyces sp. NPDC058686]|uniref:DUF1775 domain-containing protein n=1 Tax=Streptomyces sp. NPDC058686 TaxID=3346599 RepID=UPI0036664938